MNTANKKYNLVYCDPPWAYKDSANAGQRGAEHKYPVMNLEDIKALDVGSLAAPDAILAMWWVPPQPAEALAVVEAWGFKIMNMMGFTWIKKTKHGKDHFGMGNMTRANPECCLIAKRGKPKRIDASVRSLVVAQIGQHSAKPPEVRDRLVRLLGDVPRIELFAREVVPGWDALGFDIDGRDLRDSVGVTNGEVLSAKVKTHRRGNFAGAEWMDTQQAGNPAEGLRRNAA